MPCYHPKKGFCVGTTNSGAPKYRITSFETDHVEITDSGIEAASSSFVSSRAKYAVHDWILIPCGKCLGCRLDYARSWSCRLMAEKTMYSSSETWFLTLTYDDEHLPLVTGADHFGEAVLWPSLRPRDLTLFLKRLRKRFEGCTIRYFAAGEYGSKTLRPHYHLIVYGLPLRSDDLEPYSVSEFGQITYKCKLLDDIWSNGFVVVGSVTDKSCGYVARYCLKKIYDSVDDDFSNRVHEFTRMSTKPGIGFVYMMDHTEIFDLATFCIDGCAGQKFMIPRYFLKKLNEFDSEKYDLIMDQRKKLGVDSYNNKLKSYGGDYLAALRADELKKQDQIRALKRKI